MALTSVVRRLLSLHYQLPFELRTAERDLQPRRAANRESILGGEEYTGPTDVDDPDAQPSTQPELVPPVHCDARRPPPFLELAGHYASTRKLPSAVPMYRTMASSTPGDSFTNSTPIK
jgi:hypothetical protein